MLFRAESSGKGRSEVEGGTGIGEGIRLYLISVPTRFHRKTPPEVVGKPVGIRVHSLRNHFDSKRDFCLPTKSLFS